MTTPTYRVEYRSTANPHNSMAWDCRRHGRPTDANLEKWRVAYNASFEPDGCNWHVSVATGVVLHISRAMIVRQATGTIVARTSMPMFEVA